MRLLEYVTKGTAIISSSAGHLEHLQQLRAHMGRPGDGTLVEP